LSYSPRYDSSRVRKSRPSGIPGAAGTARWMRATYATYPGKTVRHWLAIWAARSRARPCHRAARAAAVCRSATGSRSFPLDRHLRSSSCCHHGTAASSLRQRICRAIVFPGRPTLADRLAHRVVGGAVAPPSRSPRPDPLSRCPGGARPETRSSPRRIWPVADTCAGCRQSL